MTKKNWFAEWFDTSYYHTLYKHRNDEEAKVFISNLIQFLKIPKNSCILDLACGKGRHSVTLNELGYHVLGVDLSPNSIAEAAKSAGKNLNFSVHDMREVLPETQFKAVFNLFTSFGYFDSTSDNEKMVQSVSEMLEDEGLFIIDFMNAHKVIEQLVPIENKTIDGIKFDITRRFDGSHIFKDIRFFDDGKDFHFTERVQALKLSDFESLLKSNGFNILTTFGNFDLTEFNKENSDRLIIIAQKNK